MPAIGASTTGVATRSDPEAVSDVGRACAIVRRTAGRAQIGAASPSGRALRCFFLAFAGFGASALGLSSPGPGDRVERPGWAGSSRRQLAVLGDEVDQADVLTGRPGSNFCGNGADGHGLNCW